MKLQSGMLSQVSPPSLRARFTSTTVRSRKPQGTRTSPRFVQSKAIVAEEAPTISQQLLDARKIAVDLFASNEAQAHPALIACFEGILTPGTTETDIDKQIFHLTASQYGTRKHWHQRLPRIGMNTVHPIYEHAPDAVLKADDIVYVDLGPVFGDIEADFARTYVLGHDEEKLKLTDALTKVFAVCKQHYLANPSITGADFFAFVRKTCTQAGYEYANPNYCAHLVGRWSHDREFGSAPEHYACPECNTPMDAPGPEGQQRMWILEIHLLQDPSVGKYGGFYEDLLNI